MSTVHISREEVTGVIESSRRVKLSKRMSYLLRHHPEAEQLAPDERGFVPLGALADALDVRIEELLEVAGRDPRGRFEIMGEMIRAAYGHSYPVDEAGKICDPPPVLYHGTPRDKVETILREGLKAMGRQMVHMSATAEDARNVGRRRDPEPVVLRVDAAGASEAGICFRRAGRVYLAEHIPPQFLQPLEHTDNP